MDVKIVQIVVREWKSGEKSGAEIVGLGDDNNIYEWHRGTGKWILSVMTSK